MSEELKDIKKRLISMVQNEVFSNSEHVDAKELGEVIDMIKDISETIVNCDIAESMEKATDEEKEEYTSKYMPEYKKQRYYTYPKIYRDFPEDPEYMRDLDRTARNRMYFTDPNQPTQDSRNGRAYISRRYFMEAKEKGKDIEMEMEKYIRDLSDDITEMIENMTPNDKTILKQKIAGLISTIV